MRNFGARDCTLYTENQYLFDLRNDSASVHFDRVRAIGFDMGAGSSCLFGTEELALYARDSRFEGGYGRSPELRAWDATGTPLQPAREDLNELFPDWREAGRR